MALPMVGAILAVVVSAGCVEPVAMKPAAAEQAEWMPYLGAVTVSTQPATQPTSQPTSQPAAKPAVRVLVRLDGMELLAIRYAAILDSAGNLTECEIVDRSPASQPQGEPRTLLELVPADARQRAVELEIVQVGSEAVVRIVSADPPLVQLVLDTLTPMLPVCLTPREPDRMLHASLGPVSGDWCDGLLDVQRDVAVSVEGRVYYEELPHSSRLTVVPALIAGKNSPELLKLRLERQYLRTHHGLTAFAPVDRYRLEPMPAAWMPLGSAPLPTPDEITRNTVWMAVNLKPYGAASVLVHQPAGFAASQPAGRRPSPGDSTWVKSPRVPDPPPWSLVQTTANDIARHFWSLGLVAQGSSSSILVGDPLSDMQARLFASLLGLGGRSPIASERMYMLAEERVELLRRIIPAASIRAVDVFAHNVCPPIWHLAVNTDAGSWDVLGLVNLSDEPRLESVELEDLHLGNGTEQFAVYDLWERRLLRCVTDRFQLWVPAGGCRVVSLNRIAVGQPAILGTSRHILGGGTDLHDVRWNADSLTLTGRSDVVADDPYELPVYVPEGEASIEIDQVHCAMVTEMGAAVLPSDVAVGVQLRGQDQLRTVTFESGETGAVAWQIRFAHADQPLQPPPLSPRTLTTRQNTRGVHLSWYQPDERAVSYRVYRNQRLLAETESCEYQDSTALYNAAYQYAVAAVDAHGSESIQSDSVAHQTPQPASTNLTQLVPLSVVQDRMSLGQDRSATGEPLRIANHRIYRGLGTVAPSRLAYFLGGGYDLFTGVVGIDDSAGGRGSAVFRIIADGQTLFTSPVMRGGQPAVSFGVRVRGKVRLELVVSDADDGGEFDYADWGNAYLRVFRAGSSPDASEESSEERAATQAEP